ncbi:hypothetical protein B566_EDAN014169 [Ephemera danica]|nr:hypothetical protein B566_EDAN014169 [Ephemera danica]
MKRTRASSHKEKRAKRLKLAKSGTKEDEPTVHNCEDCDFDFHIAIFDNDTQKIRELLHDGEELCTDNGLNCFLIAHTTQNWQLLEKFLILRPEGIHARDENGATMFLLNAHKLDILMFLLKYGSDPHVSTNYGNAIIYALNNHASVECIEFLINLNIDVNEEDMYGKTALIYATIHARHEVVKLLLNTGADPNLLDNRGNSALLYAARNESETVIPIIHTLIRHGANLHVKDSFGQSPLMESIFTQNIEIVKIFIQAGSDLNLKDKSGCPVLLYAIRSNNPVFAVKVTLELLLAGCDVNVQDSEGNTALIEACRNLYPNSELEMVQNLMLFDADPNVSNKDGFTPVMALCSSIHFPQRHRLVFELLNYSNVDVLARDSEGYNALMHLCKHKPTTSRDRRQIMMALLVTNSMCGVVSISARENPLSILSKSEYCDPFMMFELLRVTADPFLADDEGCTPMYHIVDTYFKVTDDTQRENILQSVKVIFSKAEKTRKTFKFMYQGLQMHPQSLLLQNFNYLEFKNDAPIYRMVLYSNFSDKKMGVPDYFTLPENLEDLLVTNVFDFDTLGCYFKSAMEHIYTEDVSNIIEDILLPLDRLQSLGYTFEDHSNTTISPLTVLLSFNIEVLASNKRTLEGDTERNNDERIQELDGIDGDAEIEDQYTDLLMMFITKRGANVSQRMLRFADPRLSSLNNDTIVEYLLDYWPVHPLALLLFFRPNRYLLRQETNDHLVQVVYNLFPMLCQVTALLPYNIPNYDMMTDFLHHSLDSWEELMSEQGRPLQLPPIKIPPQNCFWPPAA